MNDSKAVKWYRESAEQGVANAQSILGFCYKYGCGVKKDLNEAAKWYRKSAEQGHAGAQCNLGLFYQNGWGGVGIDLYEAAKWYRKSAEQGNSIAQYRLGVCYHYGNGVEEDKNIALYWYKKALWKKRDLSQKQIVSIEEWIKHFEKEGYSAPRPK